MALYLVQRFFEWVTIWCRSDAVETTMDDRAFFLKASSSGVGTGTPTAATAAFAAA